jgi:hypothetical protein
MDGRYGFLIMFLLRFGGKIGLYDGKILKNSKTV